MAQDQKPQLTASELAAYAPQEQKRMLGERLFPLISSMFPDLHAGKITGMLLEIDNSELLHMLEYHESLTSKVEEAVAVLEAHQDMDENENISTRMLATGRACTRNRTWRRHAPSERAFLRPPSTVANCLRLDDGTTSPVGQMTQEAPVQHAAAAKTQSPQPLTAADLAVANLQEQKQMLGERLFPLVKAKFPDLAGKITGMMLEIDNSELLHMLENNESLTSKAEEAVAVLKAHQNEDEK